MQSNIRKPFLAALIATALLFSVTTTHATNYTPPKQVDPAPVVTNPINANLDASATSKSDASAKAAAAAAAKSASDAHANSDANAIGLGGSSDASAVGVGGAGGNGGTGGTGGDAASYGAGGNVLSKNNSLLLNFPQPVWTVIPEAKGKCIVTNSEAKSVGWNFASKSESKQGSDAPCVLEAMFVSAMNNCHFQSAELIRNRNLAILTPGLGDIPLTPGVRNLNHEECDALRRPRLALATAITPPPAVVVAPAAPIVQTPPPAPVVKKPMKRKAQPKQRQIIVLGDAEKCKCDGAK